MMGAIPNSLAKIFTLTPQVQEFGLLQCKMSNTKADALEANPERGHRGDFLTITVAMPAKMLGDDYRDLV